MSGIDILKTQISLAQQCLKKYLVKPTQKNKVELIDSLSSLIKNNDFDLDILLETLSVEEQESILNLSMSIKQAVLDISHKVSDEVCNKTYSIWFSAIQSVVFTDNATKDEHVDIIARALKKNKKIVFLGFSSSSIGDGSASVIANILKTSNTLKGFILLGTKTTDSGVITIAKALALSKTIIDVDFYCDFGNEGAAAIAKMIQSNKTITHLKLSGKRMGDEGVIALANALTGNSTLTHCILNAPEMQTAAAKSMAALLKVNKTISMLKLGDIGAVGCPFLADGIAKNTTLIGLELTFVDKESFVNLAEVLKTHPTITRLSLRMENAESSDASTLALISLAIADLLNHNKNIASISLSYNNFSDQHAEAIIRTLGSHPSLQRVNFSNNSISGEIVAKILNANKKIVEVCAENNNLDMDDAFDIARALELNQYLLSLNISSNKIRNIGASGMASVLKINKSLLNLNLSWNEIEDLGASWIAAALEMNRSLITLDLSYNRIGNEGAMAILKAIKNNFVICTIILEGNDDIDLNYRREIEKHLEKNRKRLQELNKSAPPTIPAPAITEQKEKHEDDEEDEIEASKGSRSKQAEEPRFNLLDALSGVFARFTAPTPAPERPKPQEGTQMTDMASIEAPEVKQTDTTPS
jgi:Ran GTPase-activating protein (RanGAP) involved in mRNA processing and transport